MDSSSSDLISRLDTLEVRFSQQEIDVADLNEMITTQWSLIDALKREVLQLRETVRNLSPPPDRPEPPPHY